MKVHYDKPKGQRVKKGSIKITINGRKKRMNYFKDYKSLYQKLQQTKMNLIRSLIS